MGFKSLFVKEKSKKRISPSVAAARDQVGATAAAAAGSSSASTSAEVLSQTHPMYRYALNEFAQTIAPMTSNDDGRSVFSGNTTTTTTTNNNNNRQGDEEIGNFVGQPQHHHQVLQENSTMGFSPNHSDYMRFSAFHPHSGAPPAAAGGGRINQQATTTTKGNDDIPSRQSSFDEPTIVDATYDEHYGDAYVGQPIRYVYPSGYQSMRPRGGPWKLSIFVCISFTWLSVFIIGHCADQYGDVQYDIDDDALAIETRWCGSRLLYLMWATSMLITGISAAYMGVIGYIKVRDFAVANGRSQPPGMVGKSDYYVKIGDNGQQFFNNNHQDGGGGGGNGGGSYRKTIYQADGTPQFWGGHIYRPTQAAVAVTSR